MSRLSHALLALSFLLALAAPSSASPRIEVKALDFNFGRILQGEKVNHTYTFRNSGDQPLLIDKVRTSCGCTAALLSSKTLAPGDSGEVSVTFDSTRFRGPVKKTIYLYANDPQQSVTQFTLAGTIDQEIVFTPQRLDLGPLKADEATSAKITMVNRGPKTLTLRINRVSLANVDASLAKTKLAPGESTQLLVETSAGEGVARRVNGWILVDTDSAATPQLRIPIFLTIN